jgi:hypothetical protein
MTIDGFRTVSQIAAELGLSYHGAYSRAREGQLAEQNATRDFVTGGSQTVDKAMAVGDLSSGGAIAKAGKGVHAVGSLIRRPLEVGGSALQTVGRRLEGNGEAAAARALAPELVNPNVSAILRRLTAEQARQAAAREAGRRSLIPFSG